MRSLLRVLSKNGHTVDVLTFHEGEDVDLANCRIHRIPRVPGTAGVRPGFSLKKLVCDAVMLWQCLWLVRRNQYDVVHAVEESVFMALLLKGLFRIPYVYDMDSSLPQQMIDKYAVLAAVRPVMEATERLAVRKSTAIVAVCKALEERARQYAPGKTIARVEDYSLLDLTMPVTEILRDSIGAEGPIVLYVGNLEAYQGIDLLLESFVPARSQVPDAHLVVIGGAPEHVAHYTARASALGLDGHAHFLGPRPAAQLATFLQQADVLVSPRNRGQNTPMKIYSYLDSGRPLLATRMLTHTQVLDDDIACLVGPDAASMAEGLVQLLRDPARREALAVAARQRVEQEFSPAAFERKMSAFYSAVEAEVDAAPGGSRGVSGG